MEKHRIFTTSVGSVYPHYVTKAERKGRTNAEVDEIITWLTGYHGAALEQVMSDGTTFEDFFDRAPAMNPARDAVKGVVCGIRVEELEPGTMREVRILDKLIDELAHGKKMASILRAPA